MSERVVYLVVILGLVTWVGVSYWSFSSRYDALVGLFDYVLAKCP